MAAVDACVDSTLHLRQSPDDEDDFIVIDKDEESYAAEASASVGSPVIKPHGGASAGSSPPPPVLPSPSKKPSCSFEGKSMIAITVTVSEHALGGSRELNPITEEGEGEEGEEGAERSPPGSLTDLISPAAARADPRSPPKVVANWWKREHGSKEEKEEDIEVGDIINELKRIRERIRIPDLLSQSQGFGQLVDGGSGGPSSLPSNERPPAPAMGTAGVESIQKKLAALVLPLQSAPTRITTVPDRAVLELLSPNPPATPTTTPTPAPPRQHFADVVGAVQKDARERVARDIQRQVQNECGQMREERREEPVPKATAPRIPDQRMQNSADALLANGTKHRPEPGHRSSQPIVPTEQVRHERSATQKPQEVKLGQDVVTFLATHEIISPKLEDLLKELGILSMPELRKISKREFKAVVEQRGIKSVGVLKFISLLR